MKETKKIAIRSYRINIPAQFARITLEELGIAAHVKKDPERSSNEFLLMVDHNDAPLADEILEQVELYERRLIRKADRKAQKRIAVIRQISRLLQTPN